MAPDTELASHAAVLRCAEQVPTLGDRRAYHVHSQTPDLHEPKASWRFTRRTIALHRQSESLRAETDGNRQLAEIDVQLAL